MRLIFWHDAGELRVEAESAFDSAEERKRHRDGFAIRQERTRNQAAVKVGADHGCDRDQIAVVADFPGTLLGLLAGTIVGDCDGAADGDIVAGLLIEELESVMVRPTRPMSKRCKSVARSGSDSIRMCSSSA